MIAGVLMVSILEKKLMSILLKMTIRLLIIIVITMMMEQMALILKTIQELEILSIYLEKFQNCYSSKSLKSRGCSPASVFR
ncbi:hypothetical protein DHL47_09855 [Streptococcus panodentis]|uniref:Uncharacterized protein n=1 Tax=Streptococcus panodentis TaxID=1581472 RepID=A0ABS5AYF7_9STRE|nr:hypothetical protein [Streptococcus panodentis]